MDEEYLTIDIRRKRKIKLPNAVIAATALRSNLILVTRNEADFKDVEMLEIYNPFRRAFKCGSEGDSMKKTLIAGITGQDGAYLAKFLLDKGYKVFGTCRRVSTPNFWRLVRHFV